MNGERPAANGEQIANGFQQTVADSMPESGQLKQGLLPPNAPPPPIDHTRSYANGDLEPNQQPPDNRGNDVAHLQEQAPAEILQLISQDSYLPMAALINRASQSCWNGLSDLVTQLASVPVPELPPEQARLLPNGLPNNQSKANLDKKDRLLKFSNDQKADFIKLLVLLQWSKNVEEVSKTISINYWLMKRREAYWNVIGSMALLKQESSGFQIPNPDLKTAAEVLSRGSVLNFPRLGYVPQKNLSSRQILRILQSLNRALSVKLALSDDLPPQLRRFRIHDGRATFIVPNEFELDVSILGDSEDAPFRMVDFRFSFQPSAHIPDSLHAEIELYANSNIDRDGLKGCYDFLHELALSYKLAELHKQALDLARNQWAGNLRVELIRRNLIVQYWPERQFGKSWVEVGIASGREKQKITKMDSPPFLDIKWMRQGKRVDSLQLRLNDALLSFDAILRQVIAQHITEILDNIYDKLILTPLFANAELFMEQSLSYEDPEECSLMMQLSRSSDLQVKIDAVTGLLVLSPVTERRERLQYEVNRVQGVADDVVSKLLNYRCSVMETRVLVGILGTSWEGLRSFKFSQAEARALFGGPVSRMNMFRQNQWTLDFTLAITHASDGDHWWLLQQVSAGATNPQTRYRVLRKQRIEVKEELSSAYFDRLAEYLMGLIFLERNADFFRERKEKFDLRPLPTFGRDYELPEISFDLDMARPAFSKQPVQPIASGSVTASQMTGGPPKSRTLQKGIKVRFGGVDRLTNKVRAVAQYQYRASSAVLRRLEVSVLDASVSLNPEDKTVIIRVSTAIAEAAIPEIVDKAMDLEKVVSTVEQIHRLPGLTLKTISNSSFTVSYHEGAPAELELRIGFPSGNQAPQLDFLPPGKNPHQHLAAQYTKLIAASRGPFAARIRDFLTSLTLTLPLLNYLQKLQEKHGLDSETQQQPDLQEQEDHLRVHVLVRNATAFAIQYFTPAGQAPKDVKADSQPHMLARLEILHHINVSRKPMWLVRAALEEFQSYSRPSYSTPELGAKLKQEIFTQSDGQSKWLALDKAAACMVDQPEPLLKAMHDLLWEWAKLAKASEGKVSNNQASNKAKAAPGNPNANNAQVPNGPNNRVSAPMKAPPGKIQAPGSAIPNGANVKVQRPQANVPGGRAMPPNHKVNANSAQKQEVIMLD
ncbi:uncharacterized protein Z520_03174 [Fonsecaea multimorphosa CBS 102226]|uniref:Mediator of RNA polymerase II transcription subunit 14 n=1 Tax=Fonsecaea multimorphosa CBS 102226 TaxID=1442371 RepID=A0A0D2IX68_9EURO|nr:uncharacterized protein Z520_03174 [Fonsecaea multimorphosa CBS 102226]KIY01622.1 hypothetical protein Z520_03174 [Fonsecaea multimorphosa CBS 102226]OAL23095.1 hypothetical protein AYO22_06588 [Fonsecaea multimorphosa]